jgi:hypothetical protein
VISPEETGILYRQHIRHRRTRPEQDYVAHQEIIQQDAQTGLFCLSGSSGLSGLTKQTRQTK